MHFTYAPSPDLSTLNQGDVLKRTDAVQAMLQEVHPHYHAKPDYPYFLVLTQSCDLVRRAGGHCSSRYVTIAAVRPLTLAIRREIEKFQHSEQERKLGFCNAAHKAKATQFVERLLNNNEPPYFFLEREVSAGLSEECCAFLRLSVAVKADLHYETLLAAKLLQLQESFQHKLGSLVGNLYSRVGTADWVPEHSTKVDFDARIGRLVDDLILWIEKDEYKRVSKTLGARDPSTLKGDDLLQAVQAAKGGREANLRDATDAVASVLTKLGVDQKVVERARVQLRNLPSFAGLIRQ